MRRLLPWLTVIAIIAILTVAPGDEVPTEGTSSHYHWTFDSQKVADAITPDLVRALCPPYSVLNIHEDGTYSCSPG